MRTNRNWQPGAIDSNRLQQRFRIIPFTNKKTGSKSWRVTGIKRDGIRVRENFYDQTAAQCRHIELQTEWLARHTDTSVRATKLTETQIRLAETAFARLDADHELMLAVDQWIANGRKQETKESPRLDEAVELFKAWLTGTETLRERTKHNLRIRVDVFANSTSNVSVGTLTPEHIEAFLEKRNVAAATRDNDRRALSRFFSWCNERPRRWLASNPCHDVRIERGEQVPPSILSVDQCKALLMAAEKHKCGRLAPYVAVCLFAGLRPFEASRLTWSAVNLDDNEIRLEANQTKTKRARVVTLCEPLRTWLQRYRQKQFFPSNWRKDFDAIKEVAGFGTRSEDKPQLKPWPEDVMRHTAVSHYFRLTGSYGKAAEQFGNSEAIIKKHYQARVSSEDTKRFYALRPISTKPAKRARKAATPKGYIVALPIAKAA